jgi:hypothetical protein
MKLNAAMTPGTDFILPPVLTPDVCAKCHCRFFPFRGPVRIDSAWCDSCNLDPMKDMQEDDIWSKSKHQPYFFMGWRFRVSLLPNMLGGNGLMLYKKLPYPENPDACLSYAWGSEENKAHLAAWLIGHWFEHLLQICPCLHGQRDQSVDEGDGSPFRKAMIDSLLWYHRHGL